MALFFTGSALEQSLVAMCLGAKHAVDPIAHVILQTLTSHVQVFLFDCVSLVSSVSQACVQVQLTATGLQPIAGRDLLIE